MQNKLYAQEWLTWALKNLDTADLLFRENHYTDVIGIEIQQMLEKTFKSVCAFNYLPIEKTHDLVKLFDKTKEFISFDTEQLDLLEIITDYYMVNRYPGPNYSMPSKNEIEEALKLAHKVYSAADELINRK
jgi:HEPN domain-containing protein